MINIETPSTNKYAFLQLGFRPFFALASLSALLLMLIWLGIFSLDIQTLSPELPPISWHAHEMIFGFGLAVVAGFLLTAVGNWTNVTTLTGYPLLALASIWLLARVLPFFAGYGYLGSVFAELLFLLGLLFVITRPIIRVKQWAQLPIVGKVSLFIPASLAFHVGVLGLWPEGVAVGLYAGFYLIVGLILALGRRVMPMFIERGIDNGFVTRNNPLVDRWSLGLFLVFAIADVYLQASVNPVVLALVATLALLQTGLHAWRLAGWYHRAIWQKPMVWVLIVGYGWLIFGFLLKALVLVGLTNHSLALHAMSVGGVALVTLGMMARVSLGHTGRNVNMPPKPLFWVFSAVLSTAIFRVIGVWLLPDFYNAWIFLGQTLWIVAFAVFVATFLPIWIKARI
ncbi:MAG: hypothetical protein RIR18_1054 [Pseudomonadota bacterium]